MWSLPMSVFLSASESGEGLLREGRRERGGGSRGEGRAGFFSFMFFLFFLSMVTILYKFFCNFL